VTADQDSVKGGENNDSAHQALPNRARGALPALRGATGTPCQGKPQGDHLARYLDAYTAGQLTREYMARVLAELVVIARCRIVEDSAR
jgi:hypothetical protein